MDRILVVDDECLVADTLGLIFRRSGFDVQVAYTAPAALELARSFSPDLLLCDITMPGRSGIELMDDLHRELPQCRVLVLTGYYANLVRVNEQARCLDRPARVLTKPCHPSELLLEAGRILAQS
ncbi:MAG: response regulator [Acidobacteriota bacterium]|nr:response regulator [Acidobacteriota bacterium]